MNPLGSFRFEISNQPKILAEKAGDAKVISLATLQTSAETSTNISFRTNRNAQEIIAQATKSSAAYGTKLTNSINNLCKVTATKESELTDIMIDEVNKKAYIFTSRSVYQVALNRFYAKDSSKEEFKVIFDGDKTAFEGHKERLRNEFKQSMEPGKEDYEKFTSLLSNPIIMVSKKEVKDFMVEHRHKIGKVVKIRSEGLPGEKAMGALKPLTHEKTTLYGVKAERMGYTVESIKLYELYADPKDPRSLIGYCRVVKNKVTIQNKPNEELTIKEMFDKQKLLNEQRKADAYEIDYIEVKEDYQGKGFAYILLHQAITDTFSSSKPGSRIHLLDQSDGKATNLYGNVGKSEPAKGIAEIDFECRQDKLTNMFYYTQKKRNDEQ